MTLHDPAAGAIDPFQAWWCCAQPAGRILHPDALSNTPPWLPARVPGTVAQALAAAGQWSFEQPRDMDAEDWWYRTSFEAPHVEPGDVCHLVIDGLATLGEVWLNGHLVLRTENMFRSYRADIAPYVRERNELVLVCRSVTAELAKKRPRPRWKTRLVQHQQLRWIRTSLLGRMPGWSPPVAPVGPWRPIRIESGPMLVEQAHIVPRMEGQDGHVTLRARIHSTRPVEGRLHIDGRDFPISLRQDEGGQTLHVEAHLPNPPLWWPHTHGTPSLIPLDLHLRSRDLGTVIPLGQIGFRHLDYSGDGRFGVQVNGTPVYCRGACWTVSDMVSLTGSQDTLDHDLRLARDAGINMLRVGGTMVYESDYFYRRCDELGILVWQDFMFANMDYPVDNARFAANIEAEARQQLQRLSGHPCVVAYCGNSEVEQQAAMLGMPAESGRNTWFGTDLPTLCSELHPGVAYTPSTPSGGALPFHVRAGVAHYYGVGAYSRPVEDVRRADVGFATECLAFSNIPEAETVSRIGAGHVPATHDTRWKERVPRDNGASWDFEDVRDFYLKELFGVDPATLRREDMTRYLQLSRVVPGMVMEQTFAEWRSGHSRNRGALVWFFKDLWPGAGWGVVDSTGLPKASYYALRRSWQTRQITLTDEGLEGLSLHVTNESASPLEGRVQLVLLAGGKTVIAQGELKCELAPRSCRSFTSTQLLGRFYDVNYAYRFGPRSHEVVIASLLDTDGQVLSEAYYFVTKREPVPVSAAQLEAEARPIGHGEYEVTLRSDHFLHSVSLSAKGYLPGDNYFHLPPGRQKIVRFRLLGTKPTPFQAALEALNLPGPVSIRCSRDRAERDVPVLS